jgi:hypothetical protein
MGNKIYSVRQIAQLTGKSANLIYRRLTERPKRYIVRHARKEGERWVFDRTLVDEAITRGESIIAKCDSPCNSDSDFGAHGPLPRATRPRGVF